jgi:hypothetical protein
LAQPTNSQIELYVAQARGELEFYSDGVQVNTVDGWREMRISVFAKRQPAAPSQPGQWKDRVLEKPGCRVAWAAIAASHLIGASWRRMLERLGLENTPRLSVLGDGARWIWDEAAKRFKAIVKVEWTSFTTKRPSAALQVDLGRVRPNAWEYPSHGRVARATCTRRCR